MRSDDPPFDPAGALPFDDDADAITPQKPGGAVLSADFAYIGQAHTLDSFAAYVTSYERNIQ